MGIPVIKQKLLLEIELATTKSSDDFNDTTTGALIEEMGVVRNNVKRVAHQLNKVVECHLIML